MNKPEKKTEEVKPVKAEKKTVVLVRPVICAFGSFEPGKEITVDAKTAEYLKKHGFCKE